MSVASSDIYATTCNPAAILEVFIFIFTCTLPLQNPTLCALVAEGVNVLVLQKGFWSTETRWEASCRRLHGTEVVITVLQTIPAGHPTAPLRTYTSHPHCSSAGGDVNAPILVGLIWNSRNVQRKMTKALAEFRFFAYLNIFMEPSNYDEIPLYKILYFVRGMGLMAE
jgi:hypothetical protein